ncbi:unnamed protein product, partial [Aphanomyces euteiches]
TSFTGTVLKAISATSSATNFYLFSAFIGTSTAVFDIRGDGLTTLHQGDLVLSSGGLSITSGGISSAGSIVFSSTASSSSSTTGAVTVSGGVGVAGDIYCAGTITGQTVTQNSDERLKTAVRNIRISRSAFDLLRPVEFEWTNRSQRSAGFIAQEVQILLPHLVQADGNGLLSVNYNGLTSYVVARLQAFQDEQESLHNELDTENAMLKQDIDKANVEIQELKAGAAASSREMDVMKQEVASLTARLQQLELFVSANMNVAAAA